MNTTSRQMLAKTIPDSRLPLPAGWNEKILYYIWRMIYPFYATIRDSLLAIGAIRHAGRQDFVLGKITKGRNVEDFLKYLKGQGFGNHFVAWLDDKELIGLRRFDSFTHQYHLRIFTDCEVRGHYEFTPESHPIMHLKNQGMEERRADFLGFCGDWITAGKN